MSGGNCDVCGGPSVVVASSALGPISFAYCRECNAIGAEPYGIAVGIVSTFAAEQAHVADWFRPIIAATCERAGKTEAQFWDEVRAQIAADGGIK